MFILHMFYYTCVITHLLVHIILLLGFHRCRKYAYLSIVWLHVGIDMNACFYRAVVDVDGVYDIHISFRSTHLGALVHSDYYLRNATGRR